MERLGIGYQKKAPRLAAALLELSNRVRAAETLEKRLLELVALRTSQINGCGFCVEMHVAEAEAHGEAPERLHAVAVFRESTRFSARERAAIAFAEAVTRLDGGVSPEAYAAARAEFSEEELVELTFATAVTNVWNRLNVTFGTPAEAGREMIEAARARQGAVRA